MTDPDANPPRDPRFDFANDARDPNDVARLAAGRPTPETRARIEGRLSGAPNDDLAAFSAVADEAHRIASGTDSRRAILIGAAALVLVGIGALWSLSGSAEREMGDVALAAGFRSLRGRLGPGAEGLQPVLAAERGSVREDVRRGGIRLHRPIGTVEGQPKRIDWSAGAAPGGFELRVLSDEGTVVLSRANVQAPVPWPAEVRLQPGSAYVISLEATIGGVRVRGSTTFRRSTAAEASRYAEALRAVDDIRSIRGKPLVKAHVAIRMERWLEALALLDEAEVDPSTRQLARATRRYLEARLSKL